MTTVGKVRQWRDAEGWGVIDSPDTPGGCWTHFSNVAVSGYKGLGTGQSVVFEWEVAEQDGFSYRAVRAWPTGESPLSDQADERRRSEAYGSTLAMSYDSKPADPSAG